MPHAIRVHSPGGPDSLVYEAVEVPEPGPGEVRLRHTAIGVNFIDIYQRTGLYPNATPFTLGMEGAGVVEAVGTGVTGLKPGDRVAYTGAPPGSYAQARTYAADKLVATPDAIADDIAASIMLKGLTAWYLLTRTYAVKPGDTILMHAAAGGVGLILCQWAAHLGATVIGTVGSDAKAELARAHGCHHVVNYSTHDFTAAVKDITGGKGVAVVYDGVGKDTFQGSFDCLALRGHLVSFGQSSGLVPPIDTRMFGQKSASFTRPTLFHYVGTRAELEAGARDLFAVVSSGAVKIAPPARYALKDAAQAHRDLEARKTTGSIVLVP